MFQTFHFTIIMNVDELPILLAPTPLTLKRRDDHWSLVRLELLGCIWENNSKKTVLGFSNSFLRRTPAMVEYVGIEPTIFLWVAAWGLTIALATVVVKNDETRLAPSDTFLSELERQLVTQTQCFAHLQTRSHSKIQDQMRLSSNG